MKTSHHHMRVSIVSRSSIFHHLFKCTLSCWSNLIKSIFSAKRFSTLKRGKKVGKLFAEKMDLISLLQQERRALEEVAKDVGKCTCHFGK